jgi:argininosuccinate lyase
MENKLWGGRFKTGLDPIMNKFNASLSFDKRLYSSDITGSIAYARAINRVGLISGIRLIIIISHEIF